MAEKLVLVCDTCGSPASQTVSFRVGRTTYQKDFCDAHLAELVKGARRPRRGRRPGTINAAGAKQSNAKPPSSRRARSRKKATNDGERKGQRA